MSISEKPLHIDIPMQLAQVKVAFSIAALACEGDLPASIFHLQLITTDASFFALVAFFLVFMSASLLRTGAKQSLISK